jgi:hypothetical protein
MAGSPGGGRRHRLAVRLGQRCGAVHPGRSVGAEVQLVGGTCGALPHDPGLRGGWVIVGVWVGECVCVCEWLNEFCVCVWGGGGGWGGGVGVGWGGLSGWD